MPRAGAPLRGGGLALHAHGRQHAGHLRVGEGAPPGRAARGTRRREPGPRHLRPGLRADRRYRPRSRESGELRRAGAGFRSDRGDPSAARAGLPLRGRRRPTTTRRPGVHGGTRASRRRTATSPRRSSFTSRSRCSRSIAASGTRSSRARRRSRRWSNTRDSPESSASPISCAALSAGAAATSRVRSARFARGGAGRSGRSLGDRLPGASLGWRSLLGTASPTRTRTPRSPPHSIPASGRGSSPSRSKPRPRGRSTRPSGAGTTPRSRSPRRPRASPSAALSGRIRRRARSARTRRRRRGATRERRQTRGATSAARPKRSGSAGSPRPPRQAHWAGGIGVRTAGASDGGVPPVGEAWMLGPCGRTPIHQPRVRQHLL